MPFVAEAARIFGRVAAAVVAAGRKARGRVVDLMIAATAIAEALPLHTTNPADFAGLDEILEIAPVVPRAILDRSPEMRRDVRIETVDGSPIKVKRQEVRNNELGSHRAVRPRQNRQNQNEEA